MPVAALSNAILQRPRGTLALSPRSTGLDIQVSEEIRNLHCYPTPCKADLRLTSRDIGGARVVALLICVARKPLLTFQTWMNVNASRDNQALTALRGDGNVMLHVVTSQGRRSIKIPNVVRRDAVRIATEIHASKMTWTTEQFEAACRDLDSQYPTAHSLYRAITS